MKKKIKLNQFLNDLSEEIARKIFIIKLFIIL